MAQKEITTWKAKLNTEKKEVSKLKERIARYKTNLSDREYEIRELKAEQDFTYERTQLQAKISKLLEERNHLEDKLKEWELHGRNLEEEIRRIKAENMALEKSLNCEIEQLKADIAERGERVEDLNKSLDALKLKYDMLISERDELNAKVLALIAEVSSRDDRLDQMDKHLHQLHVEHVELIAGTEEVRSRVKDLEKEVERQRVVIYEGAEEKREAIRQLCFSLEHYRNGYHQLRQAFIGHKRLAVLAS
ncbi:hypothetical protein L1049_013768 [Liquidambar formosana]|uniref:Tropomyosin n=1 Tax=Liquidambar formosana TaxID=63359 RepID=A0AAP0RLY1_LIQFO